MTHISHLNNVLARAKATGFHLGPVAPPTADGSSLKEIILLRQGGEMIPTFVLLFSTTKLAYDEKFGRQ